MIKKRLGWLKRGLCITLAGSMILCSDTMAFAAEAGNSQAALLERSDVQQPDDTQNAQDIQIPNENGTEIVQIPRETETETTEGTERTETIEIPSETETEDTETVEIPSETETEDTETVEIPSETETEDTETVEIPSEMETETTEATEFSNQEGLEEIEETEEHKIRETSAGVALKLEKKDRYTVIEVGDTISLPGYEFQTKDENEPEVEWLIDNSNVVLQSESKDAQNHLTATAKATASGVAVLTLQVKNNPNDKDVYYVIVKPQTAPKTGKVTETTYNSVTLNWEKVEDADGYTITRKVEGEAKETVLAHVSGADTCSYKDTGLDTQTTYLYHIYAYTQYEDDSQQKQYANTDKFAVIKVTAQLDAAKLTSVTAKESSSLLLKWKKVSGADGYLVYRSTDKENVDKQAADVNGGATSYEDSKITVGLTYYYKIKPYRVVNNVKVYGQESNVMSGKQVLAAAELSAQAGGYQEIKLSWNVVNGASGYVIYRKTQDAKSFKKLATVKKSITSYSDTSVSEGTSYTYKIKAYKTVDGTAVYGKASNEASAAAVVGAPQMTLTNTSYDSVTVTWTQVSGAHGYKVYRSTKKNSGYKLVKTINNKTTFTYIDKSLTPGQKYYYKVCAFRVVNDKKINGTASDVKMIKAAPEAVTLSAEAAGATAVKLTWNKVSVPSAGGGYTIYQKVNGTYQKIKRCGSKSTSYTVTGLTPGQKYTFKVVTYTKDKNGKIASGGTSNELTTTPKLLAVTIDKLTAGTYGSVVLSFHATTAADEDGYLIYRASSKQGTYKQIGSVSKEPGVYSCSYEDSSVKIGKKYYYKIVAIKTMTDGSVMRSDDSPVKSVTAVPPAATVKVKAAANESLKITWTKVKTSANSYVDGYAIYRSTAENGTYRKIKTIDSGTVTSYTDKGLVNGTTYYYKVRAFCKSDSKNIYSAYSLSASKQVLPGKPSIQAVAVNYDTVTVSWKNIDGCDGYRIYRAAEENGTYQAIATCSANTLFYKDSGLKTGTTYYYKVKAYVNWNGKKLYGKNSSVKQATPILSKPTGLSAVSVGTNQIKLSWNQTQGAETYTILRSTSEHGTYKIVTEVCTTTSYIDSAVETGKTYYYKIYAVLGDCVSETTDCVTIVSSGLELSTTSVVVKTGGSVKVTATVKPSGTVYWTSDNASIAIASSDGTIYGVKAGTTKVKASANGITKEISVTVKDKLGTEDRVIDISSDNGTVDFSAVKAAGYDSVMLRVSRGTTVDKKFSTNYKKAKAAGMKIGVYCYSTAQNLTQAKNEAAKVLTTLNGQKLDYPVVYMLEDMEILYNNVTAAQRVDFVNAFKKEITDAKKGYQFALGLNQKLLEQYPGKYMDTSKLTGTDLWIVNYRAEKLGSGYQGKGTVAMWRYTQQGSINGVDGKVNISIRYKTY